MENNIRQAGKYASTIRQDGRAFVGFRLLGGENSSPSNTQMAGAKG